MGAVVFLSKNATASFVIIVNQAIRTKTTELFHLRNRSIPPLNPARNLKSQGEFTASRQI